MAIDWEGIGLASIGMDLAQMLMMSLIFSIDTKSPHALVQALFQGYLDGLQVIGWRRRCPCNPPGLHLRRAQSSDYLCATTVFIRIG